MIFNITSNLKKFEKEKMIIKKKEKESIETLCWVDWNQAKGEIGKIIVNGWVNHGPWAPRR